MKAGTPVPDGFAGWDFLPDDGRLSFPTFCSRFAFSVFAGDHDKLHGHDGFDVNALYDVTRNIILEDNVPIPYPEIYWTAEVQFDRADGSIYDPERLCGGDPNEICRCGWLFSVAGI